MSSQYLFPRRLTRRDFLKMSAASATALALPQFARAEDKAPVKFGSGAWTYTLDENWGRLGPRAQAHAHPGVAAQGAAVCNRRPTRPRSGTFFRG